MRGTPLTLHPQEAGYGTVCRKLTQSNQSKSESQGIDS